MKWKRWLFPFRNAHVFRMIHPGFRKSQMNLFIRAMIVQAIKTYSIWMRVSWKLTASTALKKKKPYVAAQGNPSKINVTFERSSLKNRTCIYGIRSNRKNK
jgi:hypothetical protein